MRKPHHVCQIAFDPQHLPRGAGALARCPGPGRGEGGLTLSGAAFHPRCSGIEYDSNGLRLTTLNNSTIRDCEGAVYLAPVVLPQDSTIVTLEVDIFQKNNGNNAYPIKVSLLRFDELPMVYSVLAEVTFPAVTEQGAYKLATAPVETHPVDNAHHAYFVTVDMQKRKGVERYFYRARIFYDLPPQSRHHKKEPLVKAAAHAVSNTARAAAATRRVCAPCGLKATACGTPLPFRSTTP